MLTFNLSLRRTRDPWSKLVSDTSHIGKLWVCLGDTASKIKGGRTIGKDSQY